jgi:FkbM family methyltransferase
LKQLDAELDRVVPLFSFLERRLARSPAKSIAIPGVGRLDLRLHDRPDIWISDPIRRGETFDPHVLSILREFIEPGSVFVDVGANIGWFTLIGSRLAGPNGRVFAIEPDPRNCDILGQNIAHNGCQNVSVYPVAAGAADGKAFLYRSADNQGDHRLSVASDRTDRRKVRVRTLDGLLLRRTARIDVVKMDTQGSETAVLNGMTQLFLANPRVRLILEFWPHGLADCGSSATELTAALSPRPSLLWLLLHDGSVAPVTLDDINRLARDEFAPATFRHADLVSIAADDGDALRILGEKERAAPQ